MNFKILSILDARIPIIEETVIARRSHHNGPAKEMFFRCSGSEQIYSNRGGSHYCSDVRNETMEAKRAWCKISGVTMEQLKEEVDKFVEMEVDRMREETFNEIIDIANRAKLLVTIVYDGASRTNYGQF